MEHSELGPPKDYNEFLNNKKAAVQPTIKGDEGTKNKNVSSFTLNPKIKVNHKKHKQSINNAQRTFYKNIENLSMNDIRAEIKRINNKINSLKKSNAFDEDYKNKIMILKAKHQELEKELERRESCTLQSESIDEEKINTYNCKIQTNKQRNKRNIDISEENGNKTTNAFSKQNNSEGDKTQHCENSKEMQVGKSNVYSMSYHISSSILNILEFIYKRVKLRYNFGYINIFVDFMKIISSNIDENKYVEILENETLISFLWKIIDNDQKRHIESLIKMERENTNEKIKLINLLFSTKLKKIFDFYLIDYLFLDWNHYELHLTGLKTFRDCIDKNENEIKNYINNRLERDITNAKRGHNSLINFSPNKTVDEVQNQSDIKNNEKKEIKVNNDTSS